MPITDLQRQLLRLPGGPDAHFARPTGNEIHAKLCPRPAECKSRQYLDAKIETWVDFLRESIPGMLASDEAQLTAFVAS